MAEHRLCRVTVDSIVIMLLLTLQLYHHRGVDSSLLLCDLA